MPTYSEHVTSWFLNLGLEDIPDDVVEATKYRILDTLGVILVAADTPIGRTVREAVLPRSTTSRRVINSGFLGGPERREGTGGG